MYYSTKRLTMSEAGFGYPVEALWYFLLPKLLSYLASNQLTLSVPDEGYSRKVSCVLNYISTFFIRYIINSVKTCQVTFHLCTLKF